MPTPDDPLERLAQREAQFVDQRAQLESGAGVMRLALRFYFGLGVAWALVLAAHWVFFADPRWLVLAHTLAFVLAVGYSLAGALMLRIMRRRMPEIYGDS